MLAKKGKCLCTFCSPFINVLIHEKEFHISSVFGVRLVCGLLFKFLLAINPQCAVIDMQIISHIILHDLWIQVTWSSGPKSDFIFILTPKFIMSIAPKVGHIENWNQCQLGLLDWCFFFFSFKKSSLSSLIRNVTNRHPWCPSHPKSAYV